MMAMDDCLSAAVSKYHSLRNNMSFTYKGLKAQYSRHIVTVEEMEQQLVRMQLQAPRYLEVTDRATENGDQVLLDYAGFCDGEQFSGGTAENQTLVLGSGTFIPGFEEQLIGKLPGEKVTVNVTFPQQYHSEALAGKDAQFICTIHQIQVKSTYELDDTFAQEFGGCPTLEAMREKLLNSMQHYADEQGEMDLQDQLLRQAAETLEMEPTEEEITEEVEKQIGNMAAQLSQQGLSLEMYCSFTGTSMDKLRQDMRSGAAEAAKLQNTILQIVALEHLEATQEEIEQALVVVAQNNGMTVEQIRPFCDEALMDMVEKSVISGKVMRLIRDNAIIEA